MEASVHDAQEQLPALVARAEAGEEIVLTRDGRPAAQLTPLSKRPAQAERRPTQAEKRAALEAIRDAAPKNYSGPSAERSQDFLYDDDGLPA